MRWKYMNKSKIKNKNKNTYAYIILNSHWIIKIVESNGLLSWRYFILIPLASAHTAPYLCFSSISVCLLLWICFIWFVFAMNVSFVHLTKLWKFTYFCFICLLCFFFVYFVFVCVIWEFIVWKRVIKFLCLEYTGGECIIKCSTGYIMLRLWQCIIDRSR